MILLFSTILFRVINNFILIWQEDHVLINNYKGIASTKNNVAALIKEQGDYLSAMNYYTEALIQFKELKNSLLVADALNNIAGIYQSVELYELALQNYEQALNIYTEEGAKEKAGFL